MDLRTRLRLIARRLTEPNQDVRHSLLDVSDDFLAVAAERSELSEKLAEEMLLIATELEAVQPRFRSHRQTSVLFDQEGLGLKGHARAKALAQRIIAVYRSIERAAVNRGPKE